MADARDNDLSPDQARALAQGQREGEELSASEEREVGRKLPPSVQVLHETVRVEGELELSRTTSALAWSALAAGLSMGFSSLAPALLHAHLPAAAWTPLLTSFGYSIGFLIVVLARQQLFTENTLTAVLPLMVRPGWRGVRRLLRLWSIVLAGNLVGAALFAMALARLPLLDDAARAGLLDAGSRLMAHPPAAMFCQGILAGWLVALMVWLSAAAEQAKPLVVLLLAWLIGVGGFPHIIVGAVEALYLVFDGRLATTAALLDFALPALAGNVVGGSLVFALVSHAQVRSDA